MDYELYYRRLSFAMVTHERLGQHSLWNGLLPEIIENILQDMKDVYSSDEEDLDLEVSFQVLWDREVVKETDKKNM